MRSLVVAALLVGCAHTPDLPLRPDPAPPAGSTVETFAARDGTQLLARTWRAAGEPRAAVVIVHGLKDHSARYAAFAAQLAAAGYDVYAFDLRGHGRSAGPRVAPAAWLDYVDDADRFLALVEAREPGRRVFLFGHSMGGAIALVTAERHRPAVAGLVVSGPAVQIDASPLLVAATRLAGALAPGFGALDLPNRDFSSRVGATEELGADPLVEQSAGPAKTAAGLVDGMRAMWAHVDALTMPLLALHGSRDRLTAPSGSRALVDAAPSRDKQLRIYDGYFHDLLHEPHGDRVADDIVAWLNAHTGGAPLAAPPRYAGKLAGDPRGLAEAVELGAGYGEGGHFAGALGVEIAKPRPIGWHGGVTARLVGDYKSAQVRPLGIAARTGGGIVGLSAGGGVISGGHFAYGGAAWVEQPLGPLHVGALAEWARTAKDLPRGPLGANALWTSVSLRLGGDRAYWPPARAGVGPVVTGGLAWLGDARAWTLTVGLQLYGAD